MINILRSKIKKNAEILALFLLIFLTVIATSYYNHSKKKIYENYKTSINNVYLKKTLDHVFNNLEPKFKKINHKVSMVKLLINSRKYQIKEKEISEIKKKIYKKVNINKLNTDQKIQFIIDQSNLLIKEFTFQISNTEKIYLSKNVGTNEFNQKTL